MLKHHQNPSALEHFNDTMAIAHLTAFKEFASLLVGKFPFLQKEAKEIMDRYNETSLRAAQEADKMQLEGRGESATFMRRMLSGHPEMEARLAAVLPTRQDPELARPASQFVESVAGVFADSLNSETKFEKWHPRFNATSSVVFNMIEDQPEELKSGMYVRPDMQRVFVLELSDAELRDRHILIFEEGKTELVIWTYVPVEQTWVKHDDASYINLSHFLILFGDLLTKSWPALAEAPDVTMEELVGAILGQIQQYPIEKCDHATFRAREDIFKTIPSRPGHQCPEVLALYTSEANPDFTQLLLGGYGCQLRISLSSEGAKVSFNHEHHALWDQLSRPSKLDFKQYCLSKISHNVV